MIFEYSDRKQFLFAIRKLAKEKEVTPQILLQEVMMDELIDRIAHSEYRNNLILKGGFLISSLIGTDTRSTKDMDTSITGITIDETTIKQIFQKICEIKLSNNLVKLRLEGVSQIREGAEYPGYRLSIMAIAYSTKVNIKVDISTGDVITEGAIEYGHKLLLENRIVHVMAYNVETIIAEKIQTIVSRGELNTRLKDFYDVYMFSKEIRICIDYRLLKKAISATFENRANKVQLQNYYIIMNELSKSAVLQDHWLMYQKENKYAKGISFEDTCNAVTEMLNKSS